MIIVVVLGAVPFVPCSWSKELVERVGEEGFRKVDSGAGVGNRSFHTSPSPVVAFLKHVLEADIRGKHPVVALSLAAALSWHLDETLVKAEVMSDRVLPAFLVLLKVRETLHNELVDSTKRQSFLRRLFDGHSDQSDIRVWRFDIRVLIIDIRCCGIVLV